MTEKDFKRAKKLRQIRKRLVKANKNRDLKALEQIAKELEQLSKE